MRNLMILAKWLAGRADIDVVEYKGQTACIALIKGRRVIKIPSHWSYTSDPEAADLLEGVIDHEALGHGRFTDLEARQKAEEAGLIKFNRLSASIQNILEDIYIENKAIETYPGVKKNLQRTVEILVGRGFFGDPASFAQSEGAHLLMGGLLNILRSRLVSGQEEALEVNVLALELELPKAFGQLWDDVLAIAMEVQNSTCTADNIDLTIRIMKLIEEASNDTATEKQPDQADGKEEADDDSEAPSEGEGAPSGQPADAGADGSSTEASDQPGESSSGQGQPSKSGDKPAEQKAEGGKAGKGAGQGYSQEEIDAAKSIFDERHEEMPQTEIGDAVSELLEQVAASAARQEFSESLAKVEVTPTATQVATKVKSIADELQDALMVETRCEKSTKLVGKTLNSRVLSRVRLGNGRIFRHKHEGQGLSTAVQFVVDMSGSMQEKLSDGITRLDAAVGLVYGMGDVLDEYDVPFQITAYSDCYSSLKRFDEDWSQVRKRRERPGISGGTATGLAVQKALGDMVSRHEQRKLLVVITDGDTSDLDVLKSCYSEASVLDVEIASVMIGPKIPSIESLAAAFGFKATSINVSSGLGRFAVERVLEAI